MTDTGDSEDAREAIDLLQLAESVSTHLPDLAREIRGLRDAGSAWADLVHAQDALSSYAIVSAASIGDQHSENAALATLYAAIVLYSRATASSSDHRNKFQIEPHLDAEELAAHKLIVALRNDAIAHFGTGEGHLSVSLRKDGVFLIPEDPNGAGRVATMSRTLVGNQGVKDGLQKQINRAVLLAHKNTQARNEKVVGLLQAALSADSNFASDMVAAKVSLDSYFDSAEAALDVWAGPKIGSRRGSYNHRAKL